MSSTPRLACSGLRRALAAGLASLVSVLALPGTARAESYVGGMAIFGHSNSYADHQYTWREPYSPHNDVHHLWYAKLVQGGFRLLAADNNWGATTVWKKGRGRQEYGVGLTDAEFVLKDEQCKAKGLRLVALQRNLHPNPPTLHAVWRESLTDQRWQLGMTWDQFKAQNEVYFNQGFRLTVLRPDLDGKYLALWRTGDSSQRVKHRMSPKEFKTLMQQYHEEGWRLFFVSRDFDNRPVWNAVWRPGHHSQYIRWGIRKKALPGAILKFRQQGLELQQLEAGLYEEEEEGPSTSSGGSPSGGGSGSPSSSSYKLNLQVNVGSVYVQKITAATFQVRGPDGQTRTVPTSALGAGRWGSLTLASNPHGSWSVTCQASFEYHDPSSTSSGTQTAARTQKFTMQWLGSNEVTWVFSVADAGSTPSPIFTLKGPVGSSPASQAAKAIPEAGRKKATPAVRPQAGAGRPRRVVR